MSILNNTEWQTATASNGGTGCVQLRRKDGRAELRDSKLGDASPILQMNRTELAAFLDGARKGEFDHLLAGLD